MLISPKPVFKSDNPLLRSLRPEESFLAPATAELMPLAKDFRPLSCLSAKSFNPLAMLFKPSAAPLILEDCLLSESLISCTLANVFSSPFSDALAAIDERLDLILLLLPAFNLEAMPSIFEARDLITFVEDIKSFTPLEPLLNPSFKLSAPACSCLDPFCNSLAPLYEELIPLSNAE